MKRISREREREREMEGRGRERDRERQREGEGGRSAPSLPPSLLIVVSVESKA